MILAFLLAVNVPTAVLLFALLVERLVPTSLPDERVTLAPACARRGRFPSRSADRVISGEAATTAARATASPVLSASKRPDCTASRSGADLLDPQPTPLVADLAHGSVGE